MLTRALQEVGFDVLDGSPRLFFNRGCRTYARVEGHRWRPRVFLFTRLPGGLIVRSVSGGVGSLSESVQDLDDPGGLVPRVAAHRAHVLGMLAMMSEARDGRTPQPSVAMARSIERDARTRRCERSTETSAELALGIVVGLHEVRVLVSSKPRERLLRRGVLALSVLGAWCVLVVTAQPTLAGVVSYAAALVAGAMWLRWHEERTLAVTISPQQLVVEFPAPWRRPLRIRLDQLRPVVVLEDGLALVESGGHHWVRGFGGEAELEWLWDVIEYARRRSLRPEEDGPGRGSMDALLSERPRR